MISQNDMPLFQAIQEWINIDNIPFHIPGHKRGRGIAPELINSWGASVFQSDLTEVPGLDNLFMPTGAIEQAQNLAAEAFGAKKTYFLVNGTSAGIIAAILGICAPGDKICLPRNVHKSAIHGLILSGAVPIWLQPEYDNFLGISHSITPETVAETLAKYPDIKAVFMVSPTYYGVCGNMEKIALITHNYNIPLLVDEAHGAHFHFHRDLPISALSAGADLTIQSSHKVLTSLTQSSMLHIQGNLINIDQIEKSLALIQSTSPSYLLLASLDVARRQMAIEGENLLNKTLELAREARAKINAIPGLSTLDKSAHNQPGFFDLDLTRLTIIVSKLGLTGDEADLIFNDELGVTAEIASPKALTFVITMGNTSKDIENLINACENLAQNYRRNSDINDDETAKFNFNKNIIFDPSLSITPRAAFFGKNEPVAIEKCQGRISAELICPYPPGIPLLMPGESITQEALDYLLLALKSGVLIVGCSDPSLKSIKVLMKN